jgi:uncharacterized protein
MRCRFAAILAVAILAAGCFGGPAPKLNYYTLATPQAPGASGATSTLSVFVGPVTVPEGVDRPQMVLRSGANQVDIDDFHRWAEPVKYAIPRVLADALMKELATQRVMTTRQSSVLDFDYRVAIDVQRFDSSLGDGASLDALWTLRDKAGAIRTGRTVAQERAGDYDGIAAAHGRALERLARDIAAAIKGLPPS